ncbi:MAG TPA: AraC family transcriptional regulator [Mucilaginibacter sp.]|nr:AraC family transcriptional regulator [Mucilaginibacter sp.]
MKTVKVLYNNNKLCNEITTEANYAGEISDFSLRMVFQGKEEYHVRQRKLNVFPGNFLFLDSGTAYEKNIYSDIPVNSFSVLYTSKFIADFERGLDGSDLELLDYPGPFNEISRLPLIESLYPYKGDLRYNIHHLIAHFYNNSDDLLIDNYLYHSLFLFYQLCRSEVYGRVIRLQETNLSTRNELLRRVLIAKDYMLSNYNQPINIEEISREACLSATHLYRTFKRLYDCSPHQYLVQARLDNARNLLKNTFYPLNEIVSMIGFTCPTSFIKLFRRHYGTTPSAYRDGFRTRMSA